ncbi:MAG: helix-turn-helix domain-containing protein [Ruminococcaceae bacterium]|nr:helix-turn-helix domain-containing protein [Oscillospiraceae bacterium]
MEQAIHERVGLYHGLEFPIECYNLHSKAYVSGKLAAPHYHEYIEFLYASGECDISVWIAGEMVDFRTGDFMIINSNTPHSFFPRLPINNYACIKALPEVIYFSKSSYFDARYVAPFLENNLVRYQLFRKDELADTEIAGFFSEAISEWKNKEYGYEVSLRSLVFRIFLWTIRRNYKMGENVLDVERDSGIENVVLVHNAVEYINSNFATVTEAEAASVINMSYSHFSRTFKRVMGKSFKTYLTATRINAAERMLFETDTPITEIALACGFATSSHFIERFRLAKGVTPRQYRQAFAEK